MTRKKKFGINAYLVLFAHRICKFFGIQLFYQSSRGVKVLNRKEDNIIPSIDGTVNVDASIVRFFADGLFDEYSLTGKSLLDSPHYNLLKGIIEKDYSLCEDYVCREATGTLDGRFELIVNNNTLEMHSSSTLKNLESLKLDKYKHPKVLCFEGSYYALDGKHRLAMAAYLKKNIDCDVIAVSDIINTDYIKNLYKKMSKHYSRYSRNLNLLNALSFSIHNNN